MSDSVKLKAADGHQLDAYVKAPEGEPIGALVILQEIFGVNDHIRRVADGYAAEGFLCVAPALFDRIRPGIELNYDADGMKQAMQLYGQLNPDKALLDVAAAFAHAKQADRGTGVMGFCFGGFMSWLAATRGETLGMQPDCCVGYYAGGIGKVAEENPCCPVMLHFGTEDSHIGQDQIQAVRSAHPEVQIFEYPGAGHAFNRDVPGTYHAEAAQLARTRTLEFLRQNLA